MSQVAMRTIFFGRTLTQLTLILFEGCGAAFCLGRLAIAYPEGYYEVLVVAICSKASQQQGWHLRERDFGCLLAFDCRNSKLGG